MKKYGGKNKASTIIIHSMEWDKISDTLNRGIQAPKVIKINLSELCI